VLLEISAPFLRIGGTIIAYKGKAAQEEAESAQNAAKTLFLTLTVEWAEASYGQRALITAQKEARTPARFPRKPGEASRHPLV
jgi:16S rRNA (guanine527-N7)-methyltransferase